MQVTYRFPYNVENIKGNDVRSMNLSGEKTYINMNFATFAVVNGITYRSSEHQNKNSYQGRTLPTRVLINNASLQLQEPFTGSIRPPLFELALLVIETSGRIECMLDN